LRRLGVSNHQAMREYMKKVLAKVENTICYGWQGGKLFNWNRGKVFNWNLQHYLRDVNASQCRLRVC
jgi:hypothetical protein